MRSLSFQFPLLGFLLLLTLAATAPAAIRYVKPTASGSGNGTSWTNAFQEVQSALQAAISGDEVWVATGIYYPDYDVISRSHNADRTMRFVVKKGVRVFGGFSGNETTRAQRNWMANPVVFSGDIGVRGAFNDNTRTILHVPNGGASTMVEGIVFMLGNANDPAELGNGDVGGSGGAVWSEEGVQLRFCTFIENYAVYGAAVYSRTSLLPGTNQLVNCLFYRNRAQYVGGAFQLGSTATVINCTITQCTSPRAAAFTANVNSIVKNNIVWGNTTSSGWEVMEVYDNSTVTGNILQSAITGYSQAGLLVDPEFTKLPSPGGDSLWGTADDSYLCSISGASPALNTIANADLPADLTDLDGDGNLTEPVPYDLAGNSRFLHGMADAGAFELMNTAPTDIVLETAGVRENLPSGSYIGRLLTVDAEGGAMTYSITPGSGDTDNALVTLRGNSLLTSSVLDYEAKPSLTIRLRVTDHLGESLEKVLMIDVINAVDQFLRVDAVDPVAYRPAGGLPVFGPAVVPGYLGKVRISRQGDISAPLIASLSVSGSAVLRDHYFIPSDDFPSVRFAAQQSEVEIVLSPLFSDNLIKSAVTANFSINAGGLNYDIDPLASIATVVIYPSPATAWAAQNPEVHGTSRLLFQLFPGEYNPQTGFNPTVQIGLINQTRFFKLLAHPSPDAMDVKPIFESSTDLRTWSAALPPVIIHEDDATAYCFPVTSGVSRFFRTSAILRDRPVNFSTNAAVPIYMIGIPAGRIILGSPAAAGPDSANAQITQPFWMSRTEITWGQYAEITGIAPPGGTSPHLPASGINWENAVLFSANLTTREMEAGRLPEGVVYRLPTEAEWEFASAAGTEQKLVLASGGSIDDYAWHFENSFAVSHGTALLLPNAWGLHDMYGNLAEWVHDWYAPIPSGFRQNTQGPDAGTFRTIRGGSFQTASSSLSSWSRQFGEPGLISPVVGFRLVLAAPLRQ